MHRGNPNAAGSEAYSSSVAGAAVPLQSLLHVNDQLQHQEQPNPEQQQLLHPAQLNSARSLVYHTELEAQSQCIDTTCTAPYTMYVVSTSPSYDPAADSLNGGSTFSFSFAQWGSSSRPVKLQALRGIGRSDSSSGGSNSWTGGAASGPVTVCLALVATGCFAPTCRTPCCAALTRHLRQIEMSIGTNTTSTRNSYLNRAPIDSSLLHLQLLLHM